MRTKLRTETDLDLFIAIAKEGGLRRAAAKYNVPVSRMSDRLRALEEQMQVRLFHRTTRSMALTEVGLALLTHVEPALAALDNALEVATAGDSEPSGILKINAAPPAAELILAPHLPGFLAQYPGIDIQLTVEDALIDIVREGFDLGIRYAENLSADMISVPIGSKQRYVLVAAPALLDKTGTPSSITDLSRVPAVRHRFPSGTLLPWEFSRKGKLIRVEPNNRLITDNPRVAVSAALRGTGFLLIFEDYVSRWIRDGRLVALMRDWLPEFNGPVIYYYSRKHVPLPMRAFIDYMKSVAPA
ncbi:LysR family transcriptional regulator [Dyella caseinilytica]|uniref:LysR family transcriptional regulator n=1 Tax=Dyella caseinilytica TaxID=1849581 RepID=A0ABX7GXW0_9GAMM|nr:LysR family transcriptional regulator [Dyella caseinilytica]QRN55327.1 LysR family transcriptional regulator [Dyella caseinilytica]GGA00959.1 LysR family transcriptional regulator [Dyella caseinilytica]